MATQITNDEEYRRAVNRVDELRASGQTVANNGELADLTAALEAYEVDPTQPGESIGKPTPDPYRRT
jgi:antitoxin component HigA of HigAB toxin-antitoxin module